MKNKSALPTICLMFLLLSLLANCGFPSNGKSSATATAIVNNTTALPINTMALPTVIAEATKTNSITVSAATQTPVKIETSQSVVVVPTLTSSEKTDLIRLM